MPRAAAFCIPAGTPGSIHEGNVLSSQQGAAEPYLKSKLQIRLLFLTFFFCGGFCDDPPPSPPSAFSEREKLSNGASSEAG